MNYTLEIIKIIFYLALILGIVYLFARLFKNRFMGQSKGNYINILDRIYLGPKTGLTLISVEDRVLLLCITENGVRVINRWKEEDFFNVGSSDQDG